MVSEVCLPMGHSSNSRDCGFRCTVPLGPLGVVLGGCQRFGGFRHFLFVMFPVSVAVEWIVLLGVPFPELVGSPGDFVVSFVVVRVESGVAGLPSFGFYTMGMP